MNLVSLALIKLALFSLSLLALEDLVFSDVNLKTRIHDFVESLANQLVSFTLLLDRHDLLNLLLTLRYNLIHCVVVGLHLFNQSIVGFLFVHHRRIAALLDKAFDFDSVRIIQLFKINTKTGFFLEE